MLVDTHCHLDFERFDVDRGAVVARAAAAGVMAIIVPSLNLTNCDNVLSLTSCYDGVFAAVGVHPNSSAEWHPSWIDRLREKAAHAEVVAIGEIGLDYYWDKSPKTVQHQALNAQLALAAELELPVIVHNREASYDVLSLLADSPLAGRENPGVLHSFSTGWAEAKEALDLGYCIGITGPVTFKKADELREVVREIPLDRLLVETDAPFLAPQTHRGRRNEPAFVVEVAEKVAAIRGLTLKELAKATSENAARLFGERVVASRI